MRGRIKKIVSREAIDAFYEENKILAFLHIERYNYAKSQAKISRWKMVLDLGCGLGYGSEILSFQIENVIGLDRSLDTVKHALMKHCKPKISYICADALFLPFNKNVFDAIVSFEVIEHVRNGNGFLSECFRALKKGGTLVISTPNRSSLGPLIKHTLYGCPYRHSGDVFHEVEYLYYGFVSLIASVFELKEIRGQDIVIPILKRYYNRLPFLIRCSIIKIGRFFPKLSSYIICRAEVK